MPPGSGPGSSPSRIHQASSSVRPPDQPRPANLTPSQSKSTMSGSSTNQELGPRLHGGDVTTTSLGGTSQPRHERGDSHIKTTTVNNFKPSGEVEGGDTNLGIAPSDENMAILLSLVSMPNADFTTVAKKQLFKKGGERGEKKNNPSNQPLSLSMMPYTVSASDSSSSDHNKDGPGKVLLGLKVASLSPVSTLDSGILPSSQSTSLGRQQPPVESSSQDENTKKSVNSTKNNSPIAVSNNDLAEILGMVSMKSYIRNEAVTSFYNGKVIPSSSKNNEGVAQNSIASEINEGVMPHSMAAPEGENESGVEEGGSTNNLGNDKKASMPNLGLGNNDWQPPPNLPPTIHQRHVDKRFQRPPSPILNIANSFTSHSNYDPQQVSSSPVRLAKSFTPYSNYDHQQLPSSPVRSALYGNLALNNFHRVQQQQTNRGTRTPPSSNTAMEPHKSVIIESSESPFSTNVETNVKDAEEARREGSAVSESFRFSGGIVGEKMAQKGAALSSPHANVQPQQRPANKEPDDELSLFGSSCDEDDKLPPTSQPELKSQPEPKKGMSSPSSNRNLPSEQGEEKGHPNVNGILRRITTSLQPQGSSRSRQLLNSKDRDEKTFGEVGYTIQREDSSSSSSSSGKEKKKKGSKKLMSKKLMIRHMKPPPLPIRHVKYLPPPQRMPTLLQQELAHTNNNRQLEKQLKITREETLAMTEDTKKKVTFMLESDRKVGKTARAMDSKTVMKLNSIKSKKSGKAQQQVDREEGGTTTATSKRPASFTAAATKTKSTIKEAWQSSSKEKEWNENLFLMTFYIQKHGNCNVPTGHSLERWIARQQTICQQWIRNAANNAITFFDEREMLSGNTKVNLERHMHIFRLEKIGFDWGNVANKSWVREGLAAESMSLSPSQREMLGMENVSSSPKKSPPKKKKNVVYSHRTTAHSSQKRKDAGNKLQRHKKSVFDVISSKRRRSYSKNESNVLKNSDSSDDEEEFELSDSRQADVVARKSKAANRLGGGKRHKPVSDSSEGDDHHGTVQHGSHKFNSKKRCRSALQEYGGEEDEEFVDDQPDILSWKDEPSTKSKPKKKQRRKGLQTHAILHSMPAAQWVELMVKCKKRYSSILQGGSYPFTRKVSTDAASEEGRKKCWFDLEQAGRCMTLKGPLHVNVEFDGSAEKQKHSAMSPADAYQPSTRNGNIGKYNATRTKQGPMMKKNMKQTFAANNSSTSMKLSARTPLIGTTPESENGVLQVGERVYAAWLETHHPSDAPCYYPGVVKSHRKHGSTTSVYGVRFDDGDQLPGIHERFVIPRKKYLQHNFKPQLQVGEEVYAAWWEDNDKATEASWHPGVIKGRKEGQFGGAYGPIRFYDILYDDGDHLDSIEDYFVMNKFDYLLSTRKTVDGDDEDDSDSDSDDDDDQPKWIGVKNKLDTHSIDDYFKEVGWYVATIDGQEQPFSLLSDALRAYDAHTVRRKGDKTKKSDINLSEEWVFPSPYGICPPVHIGGGGCGSKKHSPSLDVSSKSHVSSKSQSKGEAYSLSSNQITSIAAGSKKSSFSIGISPNSQSKAESNSVSSKQAPSTATGKKKQSSSLNASSNIQIKAKADWALSQYRSILEDKNSTKSREPSVIKTDPSHALKQADNGKKWRTNKPTQTVSTTARPVPSTTNATVNLNDLTKSAIVPEGSTNNSDSTCDAPTASSSETIDRKKHPSKQPASGHSFENDSRPKIKSEASLTLDKAANKSEPPRKTANEDNQATAALGDSRSTTKAIFDLMTPQYSASNSCSHPTLSVKESSFPAMPAEGFPNWTVRRIPRSKGSHVDCYYFSPKCRFRFRSKPEVVRFLECLKRTNGDEASAIEEFLTLDEASNKSEPPRKTANKGNQATAALGDSRSTTKAILDLIDLTKAETVPESLVKNAIVATIDAPAASSAKMTPQYSASNSCSHPTLSVKESSFPAMPAKGFPNWTVRRIPRSKGSHVDSYYFSPKFGYRFRSKPEVVRFLECLKRTNGDEASAIEEFRGWTKRKKSPSNVLSTTGTTPSAPSIAPRYKVLEYVEPSKTVLEKNEKENDSKEKREKKVIKKETNTKPVPTNGLVKPVIKKGEKVYACWSGGNGQDWFPGRVWDIKESPGAEYGPEKKYDIVFDDGDTESNVDEIWVSKKADYELCLQKPEEKWIGVSNARFPDSEDDYARTIGWYKTCLSGVHRVYSSLGEALEAHDKHITEIKGKDNISATDLNFPEEHHVI